MASRKTLSSLDSVFLYLETPEVPMHIGGLSFVHLPNEYKGSFYEAFKQIIGQRLHLSPVLTQKLANPRPLLQHTEWIEDAEFDLNHHVLRVSVAPGSDRAAVNQAVARIHSQLLDRTRPLWEVHIAEGMQNGEAAFYFRLHHAGVDGGAVAALYGVMFDTTQEPRAVAQPEPASDTPTESGGGLISLLAGTYEQMLEQSMKLPSIWMEAATTANSLAASLLDPKLMLDLPKVVAPRTPFNGTISAERSFATASVSLARCKTLAAKAGGKINDVVLALSSGAVRSYLAEKGALPDRSLTAMVPISVREAGGGDEGNQVFAMMCPLASDIADPKRRLETIIADSTTAKMLSGRVKSLILQVAEMSVVGQPMIVQVLGALYNLANVGNVLPPMGNITVSNVPGPKQRLFAAGGELLSLYPVSAVALGLGLNVTVLSYRGELDFGLTAAANLVPDVDRIANEIPAELETLEGSFGLT